MMRARLLRLAPQRSVYLGIGLLCTSFLSGSAAAKDRSYVMRDGRRVPIAKSASELAVIFRPYADVTAAKARVEALGLGRLKELDGVRRGRAKILEAIKLTAGRRAQLREDPAIEGIGRVYRFSTSKVPVISTGRIVVKLRADLSEDQRRRLWEAYPLKNVEAFKGLHDVYTAEVVGEDGEDADEVLLAERLAADARTLWAQPDFLRVYERRQVTPSDPFFDQQWHLNNTGPGPGHEDRVEDADIDAPEAWALGAEGEGVLFGMFDDSCDVDHEDLSSNYIGVGQDVILPEGVPGFDDPRPKFPGDNHGTAVMGLAVASGNGVGVRGVSFRSSFTASRGLNNLSPFLDVLTNMLISDTEIARAFPFAVEQGVDVHINSWGPIAPRPTGAVLEDAIETAFLEGRDPDGEGGQDPLGMVIVFATGNSGIENEAGFEPSTLPTVIGVGASSDRDQRADFSNFGPELNFLAPGAADIATTDNEDDRADLGFNVGGLSNDIDPNGKYTGRFNGTSAACPIAAGVAGLILSVNPNLTATQVRLIMEHTCDKVSPDDAAYNCITNRSLTYGYGRVNAAGAVEAAQDTLNHDNQTYPDMPVDVQVFGSALQWRPGVGTDEFLVVESPADFCFIPEDGACYDADQSNCAAATLTPLPDTVSVFFVGCDDMDDCSTDNVQRIDFTPPEFGRTFFAIYGRSSAGLYSFGVPVDSSGDTSGGSRSPEGPTTVRPPVVTISASPLEGVSPLTVRFNGNAISELGIDQSKTAWDFDVEDDVTVDAVTPNATHTYTANPGETRLFQAMLTMVDVLGHEGASAVQIQVRGPAIEAQLGSVSTTDVRITAEADDRSTDPRCGTSICGESPFEVTLSIAVVGADTLLPIQSVVWDLGDGSGATSQSIFHTYVNDGDASLVFPVSATVTILTPAGTARTMTATELVSVLPGARGVDLENPQLPGTETFGAGGRASPCGALGMIGLLVGFVSLVALRRIGLRET